MPIKIDDRLPAKKTLENENVFVMTQSRAVSQDIRPLRIVILNLMPNKIETETQFLRLLGNTPLQVEVSLLQMSTHVITHTAKEHLTAFYQTFDEIKNNKYDGLIITGAPVENMEFEQVDYWREFCDILDWANTNVYSTMFICWAAQAGLYYKYGINKYHRNEKLSGVYEHFPLDPMHPLLRGFDDVFYAPHSRYTETRREEIAKIKDLQIISYSHEAGVHIVSDMACRNFYVTGHFEYDADTLKKEYFRDIGRGLEPPVPKNYFPNDDVEKEPKAIWRAAANLLFSNWLNYFVYQQTPYDLTNLGQL